MTETDESQAQVVPTVAGSDVLTLQALLHRAAPMLRNPRAFAEAERIALAITVCETLQTPPEEDYEPGSMEPWE